MPNCTQQQHCVNLPPHCRLTSPFQRTPAQTLHCQKLKSLSCMFAADSMGLSVFVYKDGQIGWRMDMPTMANTGFCKQSMLTPCKNRGNRERRSWWSPKSNQLSPGPPPPLQFASKSDHSILKYFAHSVAFAEYKICLHRDVYFWTFNCISYWYLTLMEWRHFLWGRDICQDAGVKTWDKQNKTECQ